MSSGAEHAGRWLLAGLLTLLAACSGGPRPAADPPTPTPTAELDAAPATDAPPPPPAPDPPVVGEPQAPPPQVIIEPADPEPDSQPTLAEAARRERERRQQAGQPIIVINDANLQEHAVGQLTFLEDEEASPETGSAGGEAGATPDEQYWRDRVRGIRQRWADAEAAVPELEERVAELRRRFYETDDAYYRDTRIKPAWDRAIDLIAQTRAEAEAHRLELERALEEGRLAGALPGWLREGVELEPAAPEPERDTHEPGEPVIVEPDVEGGGS